MNLIAEGLGFHIPKGYTYFAMAFAVCGNARLKNAIPKTCAARATKPATADGDPSHRSAALNL
jgi:predicted tellurium resistance membrane protein TerC